MTKNLATFDELLRLGERFNSPTPAFLGLLKRTRPGGAGMLRQAAGAHLAHVICGASWGITRKRLEGIARRSFRLGSDEEIFMRAIDQTIKFAKSKLAEGRR
jgi:hypothetical protein